MKVLIVEDELLIADNLSEIVLEIGHEIVGMVTNIRDAKSLINECDVDLVLLDIQLDNNESGLDLARYLNEKSIPFIYITANAEMMVMHEAVSTNPIGYITKPFNDNDLMASLAMAANKIGAGQKINIKTRVGKEELDVNDILYVEADNVYIHIYTLTKKFTQRISISEFEKSIPHIKKLVRVHRGYMVNEQYVSSASHNEIQVKDIKIPVSRSYKENVHKLK